MTRSAPAAETVEKVAAAAVGRAEEAAVAIHPLRRFGRFAEAEAYIEAVCASWWWDETFPQAPVEVVVVRRSRTATFSAAAAMPGEVALVALVDGRGWGLETVLHELAHHAAGVHTGHGPGFRRALISLWRHEAGVVAATALGAALAAEGF